MHPTNKSDTACKRIEEAPSKVGGRRYQQPATSDDPAGSPDKDAVRLSCQRRQRNISIAMAQTELD
ncbi:hypothetical protein BN1708_012188 [Verticillium longisporum]|uniref:Uncharacterized protein n=1 Tax=Verticillium longisporum TaxID=100787 RepID=A0A0G4L7G7_VERLO|nr:hypothetical protein BN1708_012188 [Verticillium longisporum]